MGTMRLDAVSTAWGELLDKKDSSAVCADLVAELQAIARNDTRRREVRTAKQVLLDCFNAAKRPELISTGYPALDELHGGGIALGSMTAIGAGPSMGKSQFVLNLIARMKRGGTPARVLLVSLEMLEHEIMHRLIAMHGNFFLSAAKSILYDRADESTRLQFDGHFDRGAEAVAEMPLMLLTGSYDTAAIKAIAAQYADRYDVLIVDYLQRIAGEKGQKTLDRVEAASRACKDIAVDNRVAVIAVASLNREGYRDKTVKPDLANLRECGNIEFDADQVWMLWRDKDNPAAREALELHVRKQRNGPIDCVDLNFNLPTGRIS